MHRLPQVVVATLAVAVLPGLVAGGLQAAGIIGRWWLSMALAMALSMGAAAAGSAIWARRPAAREVVFADLMLWGWLRRVRAERRLASTQWLVGSPGRFGPALQAAMLERLSEALEARDARVHRHSKRVARHAHLIAEGLVLPPAEVARIRAAAAVHDVGKLETPREILNKPGRLTETDFATVKRHAVRGAQLASILGDDELTAIVRHHHERLDGRGYPDGLRGDEIPLGARVIAVADTFDALTSERPYRSARRHKEALEVLRAESGTQLDPEVVAAFLSYYSGRRSLAWSSAIAAVPSRLAAWALPGLQGAGGASLGAGAAALGAAFVAGGPLVGAPTDEPLARASKPAAAHEVRAASAPLPRRVRSGTEASPERRSRSPEPASPPVVVPVRRLRAPVREQVSGGGAPRSDPAPIGESGSAPVTASDPPAAAPLPQGPALPQVPALPPVPPVPPVLPVPPVPPLQALPQVTVPALPTVLAGAPQVQLR
jgi:putative nucleotidyltransferase with HDIG domain